MRVPPPSRLPEPLRGGTASCCPQERREGAGRGAAGLGSTGKGGEHVFPHTVDKGTALAAPHGERGGAGSAPRRAAPPT